MEPGNFFISDPCSFHPGPEFSLYGPGQQACFDAKRLTRNSLRKNDMFPENIKCFYFRQISQIAAILSCQKVGIIFEKHQRI